VLEELDSILAELEGDKAKSLPSVPTTEPVVEEEEELHLPEVPEGKPKEKERRKEKVAVAAT